MEVLLAYWPLFPIESEFTTEVFKRTGDREFYFPIDSSLKLPVGCIFQYFDDVTNEAIELEIIKWRFHLEESVLYLLVGPSILIEIDPEGFVQNLKRKWMTHDELNNWIKKGRMS